MVQEFLSNNLCCQEFQYGSAAQYDGVHKKKELCVHKRSAAHTKHNSHPDSGTSYCHGHTLSFALLLQMSISWVLQ